jgi:ADP-heptose:LPS heptosyltransferase
LRERSNHLNRSLRAGRISVEARKKAMKKTHIVIVNPTKFLGNLLIALGLIQRSCAQFDRENQPYSIILDETFRPLVGNLFNHNSLIFYPRSILNQAGKLEKAALYFKLISDIRRLKADTAVDLEGDSVSRTLTRLCGAKKRIGPPDCLRPNWYHQLSEPRQQPSEFYKYRNILACVANISDATPSYGKLNIPETAGNENTLPAELGVLDYSKIVILHAGASKMRKLWGDENWIQLIRLLQARGFSPVLVGAGDMDRLTNNNINNALTTQVPDLANRLDLTGLSRLLRRAAFYIGNDSGPMHLATALGVPAIAIFGPTNERIWGPLTNSTNVMRGYRCPAACRNGHACELEFRCLTELSAEAVLDNFISRIQERP